VAWTTALFSMSSMWIVGNLIGIRVSFIQVMAVTAVTYVITSLPISVNGYGVREFVITVMYTALGATAEQASALALVSRLLLILATTPGAIWLSKTLSMPLEAVREATQDE
jgi:glycosyltransferase 2 family protein